MPRIPRPWRRKGVGGGDGAWYSTVGGKQVWVAPAGASENQAERRLRELLAAEGKGERKRDGLTVADVVALYAHDRTGRVERGELTRATTDAVVRFLEPLGRRYARLPTDRLTPAHVLAWLDSEGGWGTTTRASAVVQVKACFRWAWRVGHLPRNPVVALEKPPPNRRVLIPTESQVRQVIAESNPRFADLVRALWWTGCRPNEVYTLTADRVDLDAGAWRVVNKTRGKTGEQYRAVHLSPDALDLSRKLAAERPEGPLFRNRYGKAWTRKTVVMQFHRIQRAHGWGGEMAAYGLRHLWATDALERGVPVALVAEHLGHTDWKMVATVYGHLSERREALRAAAATVRPAGSRGGPPA